LAKHPGFSHYPEFNDHKEMRPKILDDALKQPECAVKMTNLSGLKKRFIKSRRLGEKYES